MYSYRTRKNWKWAVPAAAILTVAGLFIAKAAYAKLIGNTIDPVLTVNDNGRHIIVTGPTVCTSSEKSDLRVTVTQRSTGAVAEGRARFTCTGDLQHWEALATTVGREAFVEGPAIAVAIATTNDRGTTTDAHQWLVKVTLVGE